MIYGGEHRCPPHGSWTIDLLAEDDNHFGLDLLFSIVHYKFHHIRSRYDVDDLFSIAPCGKHVCSARTLLVPWMNGVDGRASTTMW